MKRLLLLLSLGLALFIPTAATAADTAPNIVSPVAGKNFENAWNGRLGINFTAKPGNYTIALYKANGGGFKQDIASDYYDSFRQFFTTPVKTAGTYYIHLFNTDDNTYQNRYFKVLSTRPRDTPGCVDKKEWKSYSVFAGGSGGTMEKAQRVFDTSGKRVRYHYEPIAAFAYQVRTFKRCYSNKKYRVTFHRYDGDPRWYSYWG